MNENPFSKSGESENENIYSKHVAEILWSRDNSDFPERLNFIHDSTNNFSGTDGSLSSSSWGFDDFELKSVKKVTSSLNAIEETLYTGNKDPVLNDELHQECQKWAQAFPHLRLKGKQLLAPSDCDSRVSLAEQNIHKGQVDGTFRQEHQRENIVNFASIKEKVLEKLALSVWTNFIYNLRGCRKTITPSAKQTGSLPPIANEIFSPPRTKSIILQATDFPKLDGILTVSPKILLSRSDERCLRMGMQATPDTARSMLSVLSASSQSHISSQKLNPESPLPLSPVKRPNGMLDMRPFGFHLPKEEDFSYRGLQGLHIEPERKDMKTRFFPHDASLTLNKPPSFLPPIDDKTHSYHPLTAFQNANLRPKETSSIFGGHGRSFVGDNNLVNLLPIVSSKELTEKKRDLNRRTSASSSAFSRRGNS